MRARARARVCVCVCEQSVLAQKLGLGERPKGVGVKEVFIVAIIASIGLTVALFVTGQAFKTDAGLERDAKLGALLSILSGVVAFGMAKLLGVGGGKSDERLANMSKAERFSEVFFKAERRHYIEAKAMGDASKAAADAAIKSNRKFAGMISELHEEVRALKRHIRQIEATAAAAGVTIAATRGAQGGGDDDEAEAEAEAEADRELLDELMKKDA